MAAIAPDLRRAVPFLGFCLFLFASANRAAADQPQDILQVVNRVTTALTASEPAEAIAPFDKSFTGYAQLVADFSNLTSAYSISNEADVIDETDTEGDTRITLDWRLTLQNNDLGQSRQRRERVTLHLIRKGKHWTIVDLAPLSFFDPQRYMGEVGVLLFFVLSGFLITSLLREEDNKTGSISVRAFYIRRACRLMPALALFLIAIALLSALGVVTDVPKREFLAAIFYVRNIFGTSETFGHLWSLSLEEQFYTLWPFLFLVFGSKRMLRIAIAITVGVMCWRGVAIALHLFNYELGVFYLRPWFRFDAIAIGCCLALVRLPKSPAWLFAAAAGALALWSLYGEAISRPLFITLQTAFAGALLFSVIRGSALVRSLFSPAWLRWLGGISYSLYLWQQIFTVSLPAGAWLRIFPINLLAAFGIAILSRRFVEEPFLRFGRRYLARKASPQVAIPVAS